MNIIKAEIKRGTKTNPYKVYDLSEGFDRARDYQKPIWVESEMDQVLMKVFPSGYAEGETKLPQPGA